MGYKSKVVIYVNLYYSAYDLVGILFEEIISLEELVSSFPLDLLLLD